MVKLDKIVQKKDRDSKIAKMSKLMNDFAKWQNQSCLIKNFNQFNQKNTKQKQLYRAVGAAEKRTTVFGSAKRNPKVIGKI